VLILDEPTDGLDPNQKYEVRQLIKRLGKEKAILFSTHILEEVEAACTRAVIVDRGKIVADGTPPNSSNNPAPVRSPTCSAASPPATPKPPPEDKS
jgi:ABC-type multidrug transport system ATPase subunit